MLGHACAHSALMTEQWGGARGAQSCLRLRASSTDEGRARIDADAGAAAMAVVASEIGAGMGAAAAAGAGAAEGCWGLWLRSLRCSSRLYWVR